MSCKIILPPSLVGGNSVTVPLFSLASIFMNLWIVHIWHLCCSAKSSWRWPKDSTEVQIWAGMSAGKHTYTQCDDKFPQENGLRNQRYFFPLDSKISNKQKSMGKIYRKAKVIWLHFYCLPSLRPLRKLANVHLAKKMTRYWTRNKRRNNSAQL